MVAPLSQIFLSPLITRRRWCSEQQQIPQAPLQPLQQNEVSATSDGAPISPPVQCAVVEPLNNASQDHTSEGNNAQNAQELNNCKIAKTQAVGNGMSDDSEVVRLERLTRVNSAPAHGTQNEPEVKARNEGLYWPFSMPTQDYVYEKRFHHEPIPTIATGIHKVLQPDQYVLKKQVAPAKEEVDKYGRPRITRATSAQPNHYHNHYHQQHMQQYQQPMPYNNNLTSYNYYASRPSPRQNQYDMQQMYDQQMHQKKQEQQYMYDQMQQQMWDSYQNWLQTQYMKQYAQWYQQNHQYQQKYDLPQQSAETTPVPQVTPQTDNPAPSQPEPTPTKQEVVQPEKLLAQQPMQCALRPFYWQPKMNHVIIKPHPEKENAQVTSLPSHVPLYPQGSQPIYDPAYYQPRYQQIPQTQLQQPLPTPSKVVPSVPDTSNAENNQRVASIQSLPPVHSDPSQMIQQPGIQEMNPLSPEQIAQLPPQQQIMYYQQMLAQPTYAQHGLNYNPYNHVFGIPPQVQQPQQIQPQQTKVTQDADNSQAIERNENSCNQALPTTDKVVKEKTADVHAAGDAANSQPKPEKIPAPYPFPIILKSNLEPLQPSIPFRRHSKADIALSEQQLSSARKAQAPKTSPGKPISARIASTILKSTIHMAGVRSNYDMGAPVKTPRSLNRFDHNKTVKHSTNDKQNFKPVSRLESRNLISEFINQLP